MTPTSRTPPSGRARHESESFSLASLPSGVEVTTTVHTYEGSEDGPTLYVQAAQHGREVNGTAVLRRFHERLGLSSLAGTVIAVPVADPLTFDRVSYTTPEALDSVNPNMNRVWPGDLEGSLHQRMAARLWDFVEEADAVVDLHTGSPEMYPHVVYTDGDRPSRELAEAFGTDLLLAEPAGEDASGEWHRRSFDGKLRVVAAREGTPTITPELGHSKWILEDVVETGVDGLFDVLRQLDMLSNEPDEFTGTLAENHLGKVSASASGLYRPSPSLELGEFVDEGRTLGTVYDPTTYEALQEAAVDREGILYAITKEATVKTGDQLASVAIVREASSQIVE